MIEAWQALERSTGWQPMPKLDQDCKVIARLARRGVVEMGPDTYRRRPRVKVRTVPSYLEMLQAGPIRSSDWSAIGAASAKSLHVTISTLRTKGHNITATRDVAGTREGMAGRPPVIYQLVV